MNVLVVLKLMIEIAMVCSNVMVLHLSMFSLDGIRLVVTVVKLAVSLAASLMRDSVNLSVFLVTVSMIILNHVSASGSLNDSCELLFSLNSILCFRFSADRKFVVV